MHRPVTGLRCQSRDSHEVGSGRTAVPGGQRKAAACAGLCRAVIHFSTPTRAHSYTVADLRIHLNRPQIHTQVVTLAARAGVTGASSHAGPGTRCERGGPMTKGLGRIPPIRGTLTQPRDGVGNDMSAGRYTPTSDRTGHPAGGTGGRGEGSLPGRRSPGLAPGSLGWPWHPRRLATARHPGRRVA